MTYTPTTEEVREQYAEKVTEPGGVYERVAKRKEEFDRWLAQTKAEALDAMAEEGERFMFGAGYQKPTAEELASGSYLDVDGFGQPLAPRWYEIQRLREKAKEYRAWSKP